MTNDKERNFLEATLELGESAMDFATENEAVRAVPIVGTAFKLVRGLDDLRSRALAAKLYKFISAPELQSERARKKLRDGIGGSPKEATKVGETLFLVIDQMTDIEKPALLAKVFAAYLDEEITSVELRRLAQALDAAFADDLQELADWDGESHVGHAQSWMRTLVPSGLTRLESEVVATSPGVSATYCVLSDLGRTLHRILRNHQVQ